jgi:hypothetical protein
MRPAMVRVYAVADGGGRWHVLPGGMTRVAPREDGSVSMQLGGTSLDTWVLTDGPVDAFSMLPQRLQVDDLLQRRRPVSSRTGENLFWLGRYTERTEDGCDWPPRCCCSTPTGCAGALRGQSRLALKAAATPWRTDAGDTAPVPRTARRAGVRPPPAAR